MYPQPERTWTNARQVGPNPNGVPGYVNFAGNLPPEVGQSYKQAVEAQRFVDKNTYQNVSLVPTQEPPYRSSRLELFERAVIGPIAGDAEAVAGAVAVANAMSRFGTALTVTTPTAIPNYVTVLSYRVPQSKRATIRGVGVWAHDYWGADDNAALWRVTVGSASFFDPVPLGAMGSPDNLTEFFYVAKGNDLIEIQVANYDQYSGLVVEARLDGWEFPVLQQDDNLQSLINNQTIDSNGRFSVGVFCPTYPPSSTCPPPANYCPPCPPPPRC